MKSPELFKDNAQTTWELFFDYDYDMFCVRKTSDICEDGFYFESYEQTEDFKKAVKESY